MESTPCSHPRRASDPSFRCQTPPTAHVSRRRLSPLEQTLSQWQLRHCHRHRAPLKRTGRLAVQLRSSLKAHVCSLILRTGLPRLLPSLAVAPRVEELEKQD